MSTLTTTLFKFVGEVHQAGAGLCFVLTYEFVPIQKQVEKERFYISAPHSETSHSY